MQHAVLLVDDDQEILDLFRHMLRREPFQIEVAHTAVDAFNVLAARPITVIISDERMPGMSGTELLGRVQTEYPEVIRMMVTGQASVEVAMRAINEGHVFRFLTKPVRTNALVSAIHEAIEAWDMQHDHGGTMPGAHRQLTEIERLESEWHGLTHVERDASGAIVVPESTGDLDSVLREMQSESIPVGQRRH